jgi:hypothetical protein
VSRKKIPVVEDELISPALLEGAVRRALEARTAAWL